MGKAAQGVPESGGPEEKRDRGYADVHVKEGEKYCMIVGRGGCKMCPSRLANVYLKIDQYDRQSQGTDELASLVYAILSARYSP